jgi:D-glycero-alpha-D-manno-heptose-7-phosphate kinase
MATFGGLTVLDIARDGRVGVRSLDVSAGSLRTLVANMHLYYTGNRRDALEVLAEQDMAMRRPPSESNTASDNLCGIRDLGWRILETVESENYDDFGRLLHEHWLRKKALSSKISLAQVDQIYDHVRENFGVLGGKLVGAGGGGFLMLYCPARHREVEEFMRTQNMPRMHYDFEPEGSKVAVSIGTMPKPTQPLDRAAAAAR